MSIPIFRTQWFPMSKDLKMSVEMDRHWQNSECENNLSSGNSQKGEEKL